MRIKFYEDDDSPVAITPGGDVTLQTKEDRIKNLMVIGSKDANDEEQIVTGVIDTEGFDKVKVMPSLRSLPQINGFIDDFLDKYESTKYAIRFINYIDNETVFHPGYHYTFTLDGVAYDEMLRRAECKYDTEKNCCTWTLEFGKGRTFGKELLLGAGNRNDADIKQLKIITGSSS